MFKWTDPKKQKNNIANYSTIGSNKEKTELCACFPSRCVSLGFMFFLKYYYHYFKCYFIICEQAHFM